MSAPIGAEGTASFGLLGQAAEGAASGADELAVRRCWTRGGLTVTGLAVEFRDPGWALRGEYRALLQFIMNWNNWPDPADRAAMLDGAPPDSLTEDEKARIAAVVACLCERDNHPLPDWVHGLKARAPGGVCLISDRAHRNRWGWPSAFSRHVKGSTPAAARPYRVWFEAETLEKR